MELVVVIVVICFIIGIYLDSIAKKAQKEKEVSIDEYLLSLGDFNVSQKFIGLDFISGIAIDETTKRICLFSNDIKNKTYGKVFSYRDLLSSEIIEDGHNVIESCRGSQVGGAILGGVIGGGVGAVIGGLSGSKTSSQKVKSIELRMVVNDTKKPSHSINFLTVEQKKSSLIYKASIDMAREWHNRVSVVIRQGEKEDTPVILATSVADEINKLAKLLNDGLITREEFYKQKYKMLLS